MLRVEERFVFVLRGAAPCRSRRSPGFSNPRRTRRSPGFSTPRRSWRSPGFSTPRRSPGFPWKSRRSPGFSTLLLWMSPFFWPCKFFRMVNLRSRQLTWSHDRCFFRSLFWSNILWRLRSYSCRDFLPDSISGKHGFQKCSSSCSCWIVHKIVVATEIWQVVKSSWCNIQVHWVKFQIDPAFDLSVFHVPTSNCSLVPIRSRQN